MKPLEAQTERLNTVLRTKRLGRTCRWFDTVDSTNSCALGWAKQGAPGGAVVVADFQEQGRGRFDRKWTADPGANLTLSIVEHAEQLGGHLEMVPLALAVAVAETISRQVEPHQPSIKWPNDVLLAGRKVSGILVESSIPSGPQTQRGYLVAGIGVNVNQARFPPELADSATSLLQILGRPLDRIELLADLLSAIENAFESLSRGDVSGIVARYESHLSGIGQTAIFTRLVEGSLAEGTVLGVDRRGGLRVRTASRIETLRAGEVTFRADDRRRPAVTRLPDTGGANFSR